MHLLALNRQSGSAGTVVKLQLPLKFEGNHKELHVESKFGAQMMFVNQACQHLCVEEGRHS